MKQTSTGSILLTVVFIVLIGCGAWLMHQFNQPMAPALALDVPAPAATAAPKADAQPKTGVQPKAGKPQKVCGSTGVRTILVVGSDRDQRVMPPGADLIRLVQVDFDQKQVSVYAFSRDLWVATSSLADLKIDATQLGRVYDYRYEATKLGDPKKEDTPKDMKKVVAGAQAVAQVLVDDFGVVSDNYVAIDLDELPGMIDALGGVTVNVPARLETSEYVFEAGAQALNGAQLKSYVRTLSDASADLARIERQNPVLMGLREALATPAVITRIPDLYKDFKKAIVTDLTPAQITDLTCMLKEVGADKIALETIGGELVATDAQGRLVPNVELIRELFEEKKQAN